MQKVTEYQTGAESTWASVERDRHDSLLAVLDALIQLRGTLPAEQACKLYPEFAAQSVILLIRSTEDARTALLSIFGKAKANWTWLAVGNALSKTQTAGFAALLLSRFTQHLKVRVEDPGFVSGEGGGGSECGFSLRAPKPGWPRVGLYHLTQFAERIPWLEAHFLIGGETSVYYWRADPGNYDNPPDDPHATFASIIRCNCYMLFTYVTSTSAFNTGIVIANTTGDTAVFTAANEAPDQLGKVTFYFYDRTAGFVGSTTTTADGKTIRFRDVRIREIP